MLAWEVTGLGLLSSAGLHKIKAGRGPSSLAHGGVTALQLLRVPSLWTTVEAESPDKGLGQPACGLLSSPLKYPLSPAQGVYGASLGHFLWPLQ